MTSERDDVFVASLKRCLTVPDFLTSFYDRFRSSSEEVRQKFSDTDFVTQNRVLAESLFALAILPQGKPESIIRSQIERLAERHSHIDLDVAPRLYDLWLDCLIASARECDPDFTPEIETAWRETLSVGIEYMRSRY
jgi:hemoglobin-like flavoprotein